MKNDVAVAVDAIRDQTSCNPKNAVFIGRSQGAFVAVHAAQLVRPKGLLLEGVAPSLTIAVRAYFNRHVAMRPWTLLPSSWFVKNNFELVPLIQALRPIPVVIFQGEEDDVTPFAEARDATGGLDNVQFVAVPGGNHANTYTFAMPAYLEKLEQLTTQRTIP